MIYYCNWLHFLLTTTRCNIAQSMVLRSHVCPSVCLSVTLVDHDHIGWKSCKLTARTISPTSSLFVAQGSSTYSQGNMQKFREENVRSTPTSITSGWIESAVGTVALGTVYRIWHLSSLFMASSFTFESFIKCSFSSQRWLLSTCVSQLSIII